MALCQVGGAFWHPHCLAQCSGGGQALLQVHDRRGGSRVEERGRLGGCGRERVQPAEHTDRLVMEQVVLEQGHH